MGFLAQIDVDRASRGELVAHIDRLELMLADLLPADDGVVRLRTAFVLTPQESLVLGVLATGRLCSRETLLRAAANWKEDLSEAVVGVLILRLRRKLAPFGVSISTVWGQGFRINDCGLLRAVMAGEEVVSELSREALP